MKIASPISCQYIILPAPLNMSLSVPEVCFFFLNLPESACLSSTALLCPHLRPFSFPFLSFLFLSAFSLFFFSHASETVTSTEYLNQYLYISDCFTSINTESYSGPKEEYDRVAALGSLQSNLGDRKQDYNYLLKYARWE